MNKKKSLLCLCLCCLLLLGACNSDDSENGEQTSGEISFGNKVDGETSSEAEATSEVENKIEVEKPETTTAASNEKPVAVDIDVEDTSGDETQEDGSGEETTTVSVPVEGRGGNAKYNYLRDIISENGCLGGMAYIEMVGSDWNEDYIYNCLEYDTIAEYASAFENATVVLGEGDQLFALMPANGCSLSIYPTSISMDGEYIDDLDAPLFEGEEGEHVLLRCMVGDVYSNVLIKVTNGTETYELRPAISGERAYVMVDADGWYDFAPFDIRSVEYEAMRWLAESYHEYIDEELLAGYSMEYLGALYNYNHYMLKFGMFREKDDGGLDFGEVYAIDTIYTYRFNDETGFYEVIGGGVYFESVADAEEYIMSLDGDTEAVG